MTVELFNPLPATLTHYETALVEALGGPANVHVTRIGVERHEGTFARRLTRQVLTRVTARDDASPLVVLWPSFGLFDPWSWSWVARRRPVLVVVHDPEPLRAQHGYGALARRLGSLGQTERVRVVAHSTPARDVLRLRGWEPLVLPIPMLAPETAPRPPGSTVLVLGQHKPARSLSVLEELATAPELDGFREVWGRGWPAVEGWAVHDTFLSEDQFVQVLRGARCLVLPYERFFQSEVTLRALEQRVPVAATRHAFLEEVLGVDWPGFVGVDGWAGAVSRASSVSGDTLVQTAERAGRMARAAWRSAVLGSEIDRIDG